MKKELKKVNKKVETPEEEYAREEKEAKKNLLKFIKKNPGVTLRKLLNDFTGLDEYEFFKTMVLLFEEEGIVSDSGCFFPDEATRQKMSKEGSY